MSAFDGVAKQLEELEPVGSMDWLRSWMMLETEMMRNLADECAADQSVILLTDDERADHMSAYLELNSWQAVIMKHVRRGYAPTFVLTEGEAK